MATDCGEVMTDGRYLLLEEIDAARCTRVTSAGLQCLLKVCVCGCVCGCVPVCVPLCVAVCVAVCGCVWCRPLWQIPHALFAIVCVGMPLPQAVGCE